MKENPSSEVKHPRHVIKSSNSRRIEEKKTFLVREEKKEFCVERINQIIEN